jgi:hydrogenase expression/formation protein HypE
MPQGPSAIQPGDELIVSGPIGRHGVAILAAREQLGFHPPPASDCGTLINAVQALMSAGIPVRAMRDATRGGLAAVLHEWAATCGHTLEIDEARVPVTDDVRGVCELLGLDPIFMACEGTMAVAVPPGTGSVVLRTLRACAETEQAAIIGRVSERNLTSVAIQRLFGRLQALEDPAGVHLPRIC